MYTRGGARLEIRQQLLERVAVAVVVIIIIIHKMAVVPGLLRVCGEGAVAKMGQMPQALPVWEGVVSSGGFCNAWSDVYTASCQTRWDVRRCSCTCWQGAISATGEPFAAAMRFTTCLPRQVCHGVRILQPLNHKSGELEIQPRLHPHRWVQASHPDIGRV